MKKVDINYLRRVIDAFLRRVDSIEKYNGQLIIDENS